METSMHCFVNGKLYGLKMALATAKWAFKAIKEVWSRNRRAHFPASSWPTGREPLPGSVLPRTVSQSPAGGSAEMFLLRGAAWQSGGKQVAAAGEGRTIKSGQNVWIQGVFTPRKSSSAFFGLDENTIYLFRFGVFSFHIAFFARVTQKHHVCKDCPVIGQKSLGRDNTVKDRSKTIMEPQRAALDAVIIIFIFFINLSVFGKFGSAYLTTRSLQFWKAASD